MTGNQLFEASLDLLGLRNENAQAPSDTDDLKSRALTLINTALAEVSTLDCRIRRCEHTVKSIPSMESEIDCSDIVLHTVLPYAVARLLIIGEDEALAASMSRLCEEGKKGAIRFGKAKAQPIAEVYK